MMFWTDWISGYDEIERADLAGENRQFLVHRKYGRLPVSLVIDFEAERIYWISSIGDIEYTDVDGNYSRSVDSGIGYTNIKPVDLAIYGEIMFWVDRNTRSIHWFNITHPFAIHSFGHLTDGHLVGAVVSDESRQPVGR